MTPKLEHYRDAFLVNLYLRAVNGQDGGFVFDAKLAAVTPQRIGRAYVLAMLDELRGNGLADTTNDPNHGVLHHITYAGIRHVESQLEEDSGFIKNYYDDGEGVFDRLELYSTSSDIDDGSTGGWTPLPIERGSADYLEAVKAVMNAIAVVESDMAYATANRRERDSIAASMKEGVLAMKERFPTKAQVNASIIAPLRHLTHTFPDAPTGETAKETLKAILGWLASFEEAKKAT